MSQTLEGDGRTIRSLTENQRFLSSDEDAKYFQREPTQFIRY